MQTITPQALKALIDANTTPILIDVREPFEHNDFNIGGTLIPLQTVMQQLSNIPTNVPVVVYCAKGIRSSIAIQKLQDKFDYQNLINLSGGMQAWCNMVK